MKELGEYSTQLHHQVGETVQKLGINCLFVLVNEPEAEDIARGALGVETEICDTHQDLLTKLLEKVRPGDRLLFKASHSVGLNQVVRDFKKLWNDN
jgi:UDP-N-acetylmuramoyl-tripeptide--D-alanyl-D-alanine ligase